MRELDVLLEPWFERHAAAMSAGELADFQRLLDANDMDLHAWITGRSVPADPAFAALIERIVPR